MTNDLNTLDQNTEDESKFKQQIVQLMSTAHNNLETIEKTSQEVQSLLIELRKGKRKAKTSTSETESESQVPPCKELMTQSK